MERWWGSDWLFRQSMIVPIGGLGGEQHYRSLMDVDSGLLTRVSYGRWHT